MMHIIGMNMCCRDCTLNSNPLFLVPLFSNLARLPHLISHCVVQLILLFFQHQKMFPFDLHTAYWKQSKKWRRPRDNTLNQSLCPCCLLTMHLEVDLLDGLLCQLGTYGWYILVHHNGKCHAQAFYWLFNSCTMANLFPHYVEYNMFFVTTALWSSTNLWCWKYDYAELSTR